MSFSRLVAVVSGVVFLSHLSYERLHTLVFLIKSDTYEFHRAIEPYVYYFSSPSVILIAWIYNPPPWEMVSEFTISPGISSLSHSVRISPPKGLVSPQKHDNTNSLNTRYTGTSVN